MEIENITLSEVTQTQKDIDGILAMKYRIPTLYSTDPKKLNKKEGPRENV